ncbi:hypothetical protein TCAL_01161 [Tigriopus californicus]|uniref:Major facilitator superfamily (MFS) profile domain-containing protein n=1 Tax=Tigriopus californicus TaxID=6832 RepID=A0A553NY54_TIGCA|nr:D-xylose transporter-like [Tigriopus californicus]TRY70363.1 hypothetical protein TCAL_01161 [Tigriopus californicus]
MIEQGFTFKNSVTLTLLTLAFIVGEISHFLIGTVSQEMANDLHFGKQKCYPNETLSNLDLDDIGEICRDFETEEACESDGVNGTCVFKYSGQGIEYQVLAGPIFVVIFTLSGVFMGFLGDKVSRTKLLGVCIMLFSCCGCLMAVVTQYWHLVILRMGVAAGEAAMRPVAGSFLAELFDPSTRGVANGIFSWGVYIGYGLTFVIGNYVPDANILGYTWRPGFIIGCVLGIPIAIIIFFYEDPKYARKKPEDLAVEIEEKAKEALGEDIIIKENEDRYWQSIGKAFCQSSMILLFIAAAVRHTGGYSWSYNTQLYFEEYFRKENPGISLALCSIIGGSFGVFVGGFLSDLAVRRMGLHSRLWILSVCLVCATPFSVCVLALEPPLTYYMLLIYYFFAETWFAVLFTVIVEIVPANIRSVCIGLFLFLMNNIGGNIPILVEPVSEAFGDLRSALYIFFPGMVAASSILFLIASYPLYQEHKRKTLSEVRLVD